MTITITEYLGQRTDVAIPLIQPAHDRTNALCPFMGRECAKVRKGQAPICSIHESVKGFWIVCEHRLCATTKSIPLSTYQQQILLEIAKVIFSPLVTPQEVAVKRSVSMPVTSGGEYHADYIMVLNSDNYKITGPRKVIIEMQGGGETSNTGAMTQFVKKWERGLQITNEQLRIPIAKVNTIETNAWRRQQEQFILKGNIARLTGGGIVFCVGRILYNYLLAKIDLYKPKNLQQHAWTLAILCFDVDETKPVNPGPIPLKIDTERALFTDYINFVQALVAQGEPFPAIFMGVFDTLDGYTKIIS
jgi:hypothetical protein